MGLLRAIFDTIKRLLGFSAPPVLALTSSSSVATSANEFEDGDNDSLEISGEHKDADNQDGARQGSSVEDAWGDLQALIAKFEAEALDLAGVALHPPESYWARAHAIARATSAGATPNDAASSAGFRDHAHWMRVHDYVRAKWTRLIDDESAGPRLELDPRFARAPDSGKNSRDTNSPLRRSV
jgi:hypothetical protein